LCPFISPHQEEKEEEEKEDEEEEEEEETQEEEEEEEEDEEEEKEEEVLSRRHPMTWRAISGKPYRRRGDTRSRGVRLVGGRQSGHLAPGA